MEKIKVGLAAFGMSGSVFHAPFLNIHPGFELSAIVERSRDDAKAIYPEVRILRSFDELAEDESIELIVVNTPDPTHFSMAHKALKAGKHVVVEKPFVLSVGQAEELISLANHKEKILSVYQNRRWDGDSLTVRNILQQGLLGRVVEFQSNFCRFRPVPVEGTWKEDGKVTGLTYNLGSHLIYEAISFFGIPDSISGDLDTFRDGGNIEDYFVIRMNYPRMRAVLRASYMEREPSPRYVIHGDKGSFVKYGTDPQEAQLKMKQIPQGIDWGKEDSQFWGLLHTEIDGKVFREKIQTLPGSYQNYYDNIYEAIREGKPLIVTPSDAANVIKIIEAAHKSSQNGSVIEM